MATLQVLAVVLMLFQLASIKAVNPGLKIRASQAGLNYAASEAVKVLSRDMQGKTIPNQHGKSDAKVGNVEWWVTGIRVTSFRKPTTTVVVNPGAGITWSARGAGVSLRADWRYTYKVLKGRKKRSWFRRVVDKVKEKIKKLVRISDHGSLDVSVSGVDFSLSVKLGKNSAGRLTISSTGCTSSIGNVGVKIHGAMSWFYNIFRKQIAGLIKKGLQGQLCKSARKAIDENAARQLTKLKLKFNMDKVELDYHLTSPPVFRPGYLETSHKGEFLWKNGRNSKDHAEAHPLSGSGGEKMLTVSVSDYVMDSLGRVLHNHNVLSHNLKAGDLLGKDKDLLRTTCPGAMCVGTFLPQVGDQYPNSQIVINLKTTNPPTLTVESNRLVGHFRGSMNFNVQQPTGREVYLFAVNMEFTVALRAKISGEHKIIARVDTLTPRISVTDTKIPGVADAALTWIFNAISQKFIIPQLNEVGKIGVDIPNMDDVHFINPELKLTDGAVVIASDLQYRP